MPTGFCNIEDTMSLGMLLHHSSKTIWAVHFYEDTLKRGYNILQ